MGLVLAGNPFGPTVGASETDADLATQAELDAVKASVQTLMLRSVSAGAPGAQATGTYWWPSGAGLIASGSGANTPPDFLVFNSADWPGLTSMNLAANLATNGAQTGTFTFGLYPATIGGSTTNPTWTLGTVVSGSTAAFATPSSGGTRVSSGSFTPPASGTYAFGVVISTAAVAANTRVEWALQLRGNAS